MGKVIYNYSKILRNCNLYCRREGRIHRQIHDFSYQILSLPVPYLPSFLYNCYQNRGHKYLHCQILETFVECQNIE